MRGEEKEWRNGSRRGRQRVIVGKMSGVRVCRKKRYEVRVSYGRYVVRTDEEEECWRGQKDER